MADIFDIALGKALDSVGSAGSQGAAPSQDKVFDALIGQESGGKQFDKNGAPLASKAGAIGIAQVMPGTAPEAAKLAGVEYDEMRYRTDAEYNKALGRAYFNKQLQDFDGDTARALAAYNAGPQRLRTALATAEKNGTPEAWMQYLPRETQQYVPSIMRKVGLGMPVTPSKDFVTPTGSEYVDAAKAREKATLADYGKELVASAVEGVGSMVQFAGEGAAALANTVTGSSDYEGFNPLKPVSGAIRDTMTEGGKQARAGANVEGSVPDLLAGDAELPSSVDSWLMMAFNGFGSLLTTLVPMAGPAARVASLTKAARAAEAAGDAAKAAELLKAAEAASRTSRAIGVGTGGAMTGGAAAEDVRQTAAASLSKMSHDQLMAEVPAYAEAFQATGDEQSARQAVVNSAAQYAALGAAAFGAAGGYLNARVLEDFVAKKGMAAVLGDSIASRAGRAAVGGGVGSLAEGGQEVTEKVGQNVGENIGLGRAADTNVLRNTAGDFLGGAIVGGGVGTVGGAMTGPSAQPVVPPALQPVADKAAEPNSPLSKAAMAGNASALSAPAQPGVDPAQSGQPPADPRGPAADDLVQRVRNLEEGIRNEGWLDNLRADGLDSRDVMLDMALARNIKAPRRAREEALERIESATYFANRDAAPAAPMDSIQNNPAFDFTTPETQPAAPREVPSLEAVAGALRDPDLRGKISDQDRQQLLYLYNLANNSQGENNIRVSAAQQALEIVGRYQAPTGTRSAQGTPALEQAAPAPAGSAAPTAQQNVESQPKELDFLTTAQAPKQARGPLGGDENTPAFLRKRSNVVRQLVDNGFETVARDGSTFFLTNTKTGQKFQLDGPADAQLARKAIKDRVDALANTAAASPQNERLEPTEAQIAAGNYKKSDVIELNGMRIKIENPQGSTRRGTSPDGKAWETKMAHHYGEFQGTVGADGDKLDVFIGPRPSDSKVFVIDQLNQDGSFDEHKVMMGFPTEEAARQGYLANYEPGWTGLGAITEMGVDEFKAWAKSRAAKKPVFDLAAQPAPTAAEGTATPAVPGAAVEAAITAPNPNFTADEQAESAALPANQPTFLNVNDGGKQRKLRLIKSAELPSTSSAPRPGAPRPLSQKEAGLIETVASLLGKSVVFYKAEDGRLADGFVFPSRPGTIFVASETTINPLAVFGHEFFHTLRQTNPEAWDAVAAVVRSKVIDAKGFRKDRYGKKVAKERGDAALSEEAGGELEELVSDLGGNLLKDTAFWAEVFNKIQEDHGPEGKGIIAQVAAALRDLIARVVEAMQQSGYKADSFVKDLDQVRAAFRDAMADYAKSAGISPTAMTAETLRAEQKIKKSEDRVKRAHTQLKKNGLNDWSATTDLRDEGIPVLLHTRTSVGALITSATEFVDGRETTKNITGTPKMKVDQMSIGNHHKLVVQRFREMAKIAGIRKSQDRVDDKPEGLTVTGYHFSPQARTTLSTAFYGTGLKGSARDEILSSADGRIRQRLSFYYDKGTGVRPESGVGGIAHKATLTNIYDADRDPLKLKGGNARAFESKVLDAGYSGYLARLDGTQPGQVILLGNQTVTPEVLGPRSRIGGDDTGVAAAPAPAPAPIKKGLMSRELNELNVDAIPGATLRTGMLTVPPESVAQANAELERIGSPVRFSPDRDDPDLAQREYAEVEARYKDTEQWLKAPNGNSTSLSERQWVQVRTPSFKNWFGDWEAFAGTEGGVWSDDQGAVSKVVDANGEPLVVYHGTRDGGFMEFSQPGGTRRGDLGIFTTSDEGMASAYVRRNRTRRVEEPSADADPQAGDQPGIYALFVNLRKPNEAYFEGANWDGERYEQYQVVNSDGEQIYAEDGRGYLSDEDAQDLAADNSGASVERAGPHYETTDSVVRDARRYKNDGAVIRDVVDDGGGTGYDGEPADVFVAFDPNQVKSADFNGGAFSRSSDDIRKSADRAAKQAAKKAEQEEQKAAKKATREAEKAAREAEKLNQKMGAVAAKEAGLDPAMVVSTKPGRSFEVDGKNYRVVTYPKTKDIEFATSRLHTRIRDVLRGSDATRFLESIGELDGKSLKLGQIRGLWAGEREDTFTIWARNKIGNPLPFVGSRKLANLLGFAFVQEGAVTTAPAYNEGVPDIPAVLIGNGKDLERSEVDAALDAANKAGFFGASESATGKGIKFLFFADAESDKTQEQQFEEFLDQVEQVQKATGLNARTVYNTKSTLDSAKEYWKNATGKELGAEDLRGARNPDSGAGSSDLFRGLVDNLLAPYVAGIRIEGFDFSYPNWQRVFGATPEQTRYLKSKVEELEAVNKHGVVKKLRQTTSIVDKKDVGTAAELMLKTTEGNADEQLDALDRVLAASPDATQSTEKWLLMQARAYGTNDVPMAPNRFIQMYNSDGIYTQLKSLSPGQVADADAGFAAGREFRRLYESGKVKPETTAKLMLWSFLSRGVSPYVQESAFLELVGKVDPFISKVLAGTFSDTDVQQWEAVVADAIRKGTGQPGAGTTHNANAFASSFMVGMSRRMPDGRTKMQFMHDLFSDPRRTGREIRREFVKISEGVGIDNKVISFTMLVIGHDDVAVLDRVQIANTYNDGRLGDYNLYDGVSRYGYKGADGKTVWVGAGEQAKLEAEEASPDGEVLSALLPGSGMANLTTGVRGLMLYESLENALDRKLPEIFGRLRAEGLRSAELRPTVGRWHWESWVAYSGQEASHKTLEALLNEVKGELNPFADVAAKEGEYGAFSYGTEYAIDRNGERYKLYPDSAGVMRRLSLDDYKELMAAIKKRANGVIPGRFKVSENADGSQRSQPWFMDPRVDRKALDKLIDRFAGPKPEGKIVASPDREIAPEQPTATMRDEVPATDAKGRKVTYDVEVEDTGETARLTVDAGDAITDYDERIATAKKLLECLNK